MRSRFGESVLRVAPMDSFTVSLYTAMEWTTIIPIVPGLELLRQVAADQRHLSLLPRSLVSE